MYRDQNDSVVLETEEEGYSQSNISEHKETDYDTNLPYLPSLKTISTGVSGWPFMLSPRKSVYTPRSQINESQEIKTQTDSKISFSNYRFLQFHLRKVD